MPELVPHLVIDTPPLQALHRCSALALLPRAYERVAVPSAVSAETAACLAAEGPERVPDLARHAFVAVVPVGDDELARAGVIPAPARRGVETWSLAGRRLGRPGVEAIVLARRLGAPLVLEDRGGVAAARAAGVRVLDVAELLVELERAGVVDDASARARSILQTGYSGKRLDWLARHAWP